MGSKDNPQQQNYPNENKIFNYFYIEQDSEKLYDQIFKVGSSNSMITDPIAWSWDKTINFQMIREFFSIDHLSNKEGTISTSFGVFSDKLIVKLDQIEYFDIAFLL